MLRSAHMAIRFQFASAIICERILQEKDGVHSAIRIVDIINVPEGLEDVPVHFYALVSLKTVPVSTEEFRLGLTLVTPLGERNRVVIGANTPPHKVRPFLGDPSIPSGLTIAME